MEDIYSENYIHSRCTAIVLAAGSGSRMYENKELHEKKIARGVLPKQYMILDDKPLLWYSLHAFEQSERIDDIVVVAEKGGANHCKESYIDPWGFRKVRKVVEGGDERYLSVWQGLQAVAKDHSYVLIHDCARPFVNSLIIEAVYEAVMEYGACSAGMPTKDTIKIVNQDEFAVKTPNRSSVWMVQTPQAFKLSLIIEAYEILISRLEEVIHKGILITDDTMIVELMLDHPVKMVKASYQNIKITTAEDMKIAESFILLEKEAKR